jgi:hypothetical protein
MAGSRTAEHAVVNIVLNVPQQKQLLNIFNMLQTAYPHTYNYCRGKVVSEQCTHVNNNSTFSEYFGVVNGFRDVCMCDKFSKFTSLPGS